MAVRDPLQPVRQPAVTAAHLSDSFSEVTVALGLSFNDPDLLEEALTHPSVASGASGKRRNYQRLEWLGDRVLGVIVADQLFHTFRDEEEGPLARRMAALASEVSLARVAREIDLGRYLIMDSGETANRGRENAANLADACEALIGALYIDGGLQAARDFVEPRWASLIAEQGAPPKDPKSALQEWAQARGIGLPHYRVVASDGPDHRPTFRISVEIDGHGQARAEGGGKREAESRAAQRLLDQLEQRDD